MRQQNSSKVLDDAGIENHPNGDSTGVIGLIHGAKEGPVLAIRADIDALPIKENTGLPFSSEVSGKCHACGHDLHTTVLIGAARLLKEYQNDLCGTIKLIFQPAGRSHDRSRKDHRKWCSLKTRNPISSLACHTWPDMPAGSIGVRKGTMLGASDSFKVKVIGKGGHAAHPQKGIDPVVIAAHIITQLQTIVSRRVAAIDPVVVTVGHLEAGTAANIIPNEAYFEGTVRTQSNETRNHVAEILKQLAIGTARAMGGDAEVSYTFGVGPTISEDHLCGRDQRGCDRASRKRQASSGSVPVHGIRRFRKISGAHPGCYLPPWYPQRYPRIKIGPSQRFPLYLMRRQFLPVLPQWLAPHLRSPAPT